MDQPTPKVSKARSVWLGALAGLSLVLTGAAVNLTQTQPAFSQAVQARQVEAPETAVSFADVIENVSPAVVNIAVAKVIPAPTSALPRFGTPSEPFPPSPPSSLEDLLERFFGFQGTPGPRVPMPERRAQGEGSGFIIAPDGYIVTNNHVVDGADRIVVTLQDGRQLDATLVGTDPKTDLALIKVEESNLPYVEFGDSNSARVGDWVVAIGNPFGLGGTATAGIISARGRDIQAGPYDDFIQIDAPINQGNSGGPVFNMRGEVIGVNTAIYSPTGGSVGIGFAIPASQASNVVAQLRENGVVRRGWLGVEIHNLDQDLADSFGLPSTKGAVVAKVMEGPAKRAGIQQGDVITRFDGKEIDSPRTLSTTVAEANPSETVDVTIWRNGETRNLRVQLGEASATEMAEARPGADGRGGAFSRDSAEGSVGLTLRALTDQDKAQLGLPSDVTGALVTSVQPDSPAAQKGLRAGDVVMQVDGKPIDSPEAAIAALNEARNDDGNAVLLVRRGEGQLFVGLKFS